MKNRIWARPFNFDTTEDQETMWKWITSNPTNGFDPENPPIYPTTSIIVAHDGKPLVYMPIQFAPIMESLAIRPGADNFEIAVALKEIFSVLQFEARKAGQGEIYFFGSNPHTVSFAQKAGFEEMPWKAYRLKLSSVGESHENIPKDSNQPIGQ